MYIITFEMKAIITFEMKGKLRLSLSGMNQQSAHATKLTWMLLLSQQLWLQGVTMFTKQHLG